MDKNLNFMKVNSFVFRVRQRKKKEGKREKEEKERLGRREGGRGRTKPVITVIKDGLPQYKNAIEFS